MELRARGAPGDSSDEEARHLDDHLDTLYPSDAAPPTLASNRWMRLREEYAEKLAEENGRLPWPQQRRLMRDAVWFPDGTSSKS